MQCHHGIDNARVHACASFECRTVFTRRFGDEIFSACVSGPDLTVETVNGGRFVCDAETGELLEVRPPVAAALPLPAKIGHAA